MLVITGTVADDGDCVVGTLVATIDVGDGVGGISKVTKPCDGDIVVGIPFTSIVNSG